VPQQPSIAAGAGPDGTAARTAADVAGTPDETVAGTPDGSVGPRGRRGLLVAGASAAAGAVGLAFAGPAQAAAGGSMLLGRANTAGSAGTSLTSTGTGSVLNCRGSAGTGVLGDTAVNTRWGVWGRNLSTTVGAAGAVRAEGRVNTGLFADTTSNTRWGAHARNLAAANNVSGGALRAEGRHNVGLFADTLPSVVDVAAIVALGGDGEFNGVGLMSGGTTFLDGNALALRSFVGVLNPDTSQLEYAPVTSGEGSYHTVVDKVTLDGAGAAAISLPSAFTATVDMLTLRISLTPVGGSMPNLHATYTESSSGTGFGIAGGAASGVVHYTVSAERIALSLQGSTAAPASAPASGARATATVASPRLRRPDVTVPGR
jgi:hypothetical protein